MSYVEKKKVKAVWKVVLILLTVVVVVLLLIFTVHKYQSGREYELINAAGKEEVCIFVQIPSPYIGKIECAVNAGLVEIHALECENIELDTKTPCMMLEDVVGTVEINCNLDMEIFHRTSDEIIGR